MNGKTYGNSYFVTGLLFCIIFFLSLILFSLIAFPSSGIIRDITRAAAVIFAFICAAVLCNRCSISNKLRNPDMFTPRRDTVYYFKRMGFFVLMLILMSIGSSLIGMCAVALFGGVLVRIENLYLREFMLKLPIFILYLSLGYKMLVRYGFMDSQRKIFNINFKMLTFIISSMIMLPDALHNSFFYIPVINAPLVNAHTVLSSNNGSYIFDDDIFILSENFTVFNIIFIAFMVLLAFAIQLAVFGFAYLRGRQIFIKQHIREIDYDMDENI